MTGTVRPIIDAHLDLSWSALHWNRDLTQSVADVRAGEAHMTDHRARGKATVTLPEMRRGGVGVALGTVLARTKPNVCPAVGFNRRELDFRAQALTHSVGRGQLAYYHLLEKQGHVRILRTSDDLRTHWRAWTNDPTRTPIGVIVAMEGADPIVSPDDAADWFAAGLRCVGMAHYGPGVYAHGTGGEGPLTDAARPLLKRFRELGVIVDLTHCAEPGFFQVLDAFDGPVHASHNLCRKFNPKDRQFSDEQVKRLLERDAVIGMPMDAWMLDPNWVVGESSNVGVSFEDVANHVDHICQLAGNARNVGIGSDLDGGFGHEQVPRELNTIADLQKFADVLAKRGYGDNDIDGIFFGNWLRFFTEHLPKAK